MIGLRCMFIGFNLVGSQPLHTSKKKLFVAFPWVETSTGLGGFMISVLII